MSQSSRKNLKNANLEILNNLQVHTNINSPTSRIKLAAMTPSPKMNHRPSLAIKMDRLSEMKFTSLLDKDPGILLGFKTKPKPNICISELWGTKESYLRKTSYLEAYKELKKAQELEKIMKNRSARKIEKPHVEDFQCKIKNLPDKKTSPNNLQKNLSTIYEGNPKNLTAKETCKIDFIISKCTELKGKKKVVGKETKRLKKAVNNFSNSRKKLGRKLSGISYSTSELLMNERNFK